jgi:hypothetical protein
VQRWIDTAKTILLNPQGGFSNVRRTGGIGAPLTYYLVGAGISLVGQLLWQMIGFGGMGMGDMGGMGGGAAVGGGLVGGLIVGIVMIVLGVFIGSGIVHLVLSLLGGARHGYETTLRTLTYAFGSSAPIGFVPICGGFIAFVWGLVCAGMGLADMQETTPVKGFLAILIPFAVCCVIGVLFFAAIITMIGAAIGSHAS